MICIFFTNETPPFLLKLYVILTIAGDLIEFILVIFRYY